MSCSRLITTPYNDLMYKATQVDVVRRIACWMFPGRFSVTGGAILNNIIAAKSAGLAPQLHVST